ncbi:hypothetical protein ACU4GD_03445 [Cupriavidus basilensis]
MAPLTGAITLHRPVSRYVFNVRAKYQDEVARAINHLATTGMTRIAIFYANDGFGQDVFEGFSTALQRARRTTCRKRFVCPADGGYPGWRHGHQQV